MWNIMISLNVSFKQFQQDARLSQSWNNRVVVDVSKHVCQIEWISNAERSANP